MLRLLPHPGKLSLFAILSLADLSLTWWLLDRSGGEVYEGNPVAHWWLSHLGWAGLAFFKLGMMLLVSLLAALIARSRPRVAGRVLALGCAVLTLVVLYSASLCRAACASPEERQARMEREINEGLAELNRECQVQHRKSAAFWALMERLDEDLAAGRCSLREAVGQMRRSEKGQDPTFLSALAITHPDLTPEQRFAACAIDHVLIALRNDPQTALRLEREFQLTYGCPPPLTPHTSLKGPRPDGAGQFGAGSPGAPAPQPEESPAL